MSNFKTLAAAHRGLTSELESVQSSIARWRKKIADATPGSLQHELEWAEQAFENAAQERVLTEVLSWVNHSLTDEGRAAQAENGLTTAEEVMAHLRSMIVREASQRSERRHSSTSVAANLANECLRSAWARMAWAPFGAF